MRQEETAMGPSSFIWREIQLFFLLYEKEYFILKIWVTWYMSVIGILLEHPEVICQNANTSFTHFTKSFVFDTLTHTTFPPTEKSEGHKGDFSLFCLHPGPSCCTTGSAEKGRRRQSCPSESTAQVSSRLCFQRGSKGTARVKQRPGHTCTWTPLQLGYLLCNKWSVYQSEQVIWELCMNCTDVLH